MKKILSVLLVLCMLSVVLTSCVMHKCEFSADWSKDDTAHWHACTKKNCEEVADKAEHTWDEGKITTAATQEADGVKTFTCTVCSHTKTEVVAFTGLTEADWNAAFEDSVFENFTYTEVGKTTGNGVSVDSETVYKFTKDGAWVKMTMGSESEESFAPDLASANMGRKQLVDSIKSLTPYDGYKYDAETKTYKATKAIKIDALNASTDDVTLTFANGKLVEIKYSISFKQNNIDFSATATVTISDYGTVTLNPSV